jgi:hypothetical protein
MAVQSSPVLPQTPKIAITQITSGVAPTNIAASSSNSFVLYTGGTNGSKITGVSATNASTHAAINAVLSIGSTASGAFLLYQVASATMPSLTSGSDTAMVATNLFAAATLPLPIDGDGNPYLFLNSSLNALYVALSSAIQTANGRVNFMAIGADF